jgi:hypothetical protein
VLIITGVLLVFSCGSQDNSKNELAAYCVRLCVEGTGDPEICDTQCRCAAENLSDQYSNQGLSEFVQNLTQNENEQNEYMEKLKNSLESCKTASQ